MQINAAGEVECAQYPLAPLSAGHVRVRTTRTAISPGTELTYVGRQATNVFLRRGWDPGLRLFVEAAAGLEPPLVFGYRATGIVVEGATADLPVGTRVYGKWRHTEYVALPAATVAAQRVPDALDDDDAVDLAHMAPICLNAVVEAGAPLAGSPAVVFGAGPIGLITAQAARAAGAAEVHVVDRVPERLAVAERLGLRTLLPPADGAAAALKRLLGAEGVPVAFECTGSVAALHEAIRTVARRGRVVAAGFYQGGSGELRLGEEFHHNAVRVIAAQIGNIHPDWTIGALRTRGVELALGGRLVLGGLPRLAVPVERAAEAFAALRRPAEVLQAVLVYGDGL